MSNTGKGLIRSVRPGAHIGILLSLLAALACALQPGGRKLRFAGPCGKDLCTCQIQLPSQDCNDTIKSALTAKCKTHPTHKHAPGSVWRFIADSSNEQSTVLLEFFWMMTPAQTPLVTAATLQLHATLFSLQEDPYSDPFGRVNYPPPKLAA